jgi:hypothetical protein
MSNEQDRIYYSVIVNNSGDATTNVAATWDVTQNQAIIGKASDYYLTVSKFTIPGSNIPVMQIPIQSGISQTDPNLTPFIVTIKWVSGNVSESATVEFVPEDETQIEPPAPSVNGGNQQLGPYYWYYNYTSFINIINDAFETAFGQLITSPGFPTPSTSDPSAGGPAYAPYLTYNPDTQLLNFVLDFHYIDYQTANLYTNFEIFINTPLYQYLAGFPFTYVTSSGNANYRINANWNYENSYTIPGIIPSTSVAYPGNSTSYYYAPAYPWFVNLEQEYNTIGSWNCFKDIVFLTQSMPVAPSFIPSTALGQQTGQSNFKSIVTSFSPILNSPGDARQQIQYYPQGPYRLINLNGTGEMRRFDIQVYWQDNLNNLWLISVGPGQTLEILFLFIKKSTYNGAQEDVYGGFLGEYTLPTSRTQQILKGAGDKKILPGRTRMH